MMVHLRSCAFGLAIAGLSLGFSRPVLGADPNGAVTEPETPAAQSTKMRNSELDPETSSLLAPADEILRLDVIDNAFGTSRGTVYAGFQGVAASNTDQDPQAG